MDTADIGENASRWTTAGGLASSTDQARTGSRSYKGASGTGRINIPARADYYAKFAFRSASEFSNYYYVSFRESTTSHVTITMNTSDGKIEARRGTHTGTLLGSTSAGVMPVKVWVCVEVYVSIHDSTGVVTVKANGYEVLSLTSQDTQNGGTGVIDNFYVNSTGTAGYWDDFVIRDDAWPGVGGLRVLVPNAAGDTTSWTASAGNAHECVDELPPTFADYISTDAAVADTLHLFNIGSLSVTPDSIAGVGVSLLAKLSESGSGSVRAKAKAGSTTANGAALVLSVSEQWTSLYMAVNPDDSAAWANADIDALQIGVETQ